MQRMKSRRTEGSKGGPKGLKHLVLHICSLCFMEIKTSDLLLRESSPEEVFWIMFWRGGRVWSSGCHATGMACQLAASLGWMVLCPSQVCPYMRHLHNISTFFLDNLSLLWEHSTQQRIKCWVLLQRITVSLPSLHKGWSPRDADIFSYQTLVHGALYVWYVPNSCTIQLVKGLPHICDKQEP